MANLVLYCCIRRFSHIFLEVLNKAYRWTEIGKNSPPPTFRSTIINSPDSDYREWNHTLHRDLEPNFEIICNSFNITWPSWHKKTQKTWTSGYLWDGHLRHSVHFTWSYSRIWPYKYWWEVCRKSWSWVTISFGILYLNPKSSCSLCVSENNS